MFVTIVALEQNKTKINYWNEPNHTKKQDKESEREKKTRVNQDKIKDHLINKLWVQNSIMRVAC